MATSELFKVSNGVTEVLIDRLESPKAVALIAHPHPLLGGNANHKVPFTMMRAANALGVSVYRPNFRGVGKSSGQYDDGVLETQDIIDLIKVLREREGRVPFILMGFSFGAFIAARVEQALAQASLSSDDVILCGLPDGEVPGKRHYATPVVAGACLIHGELDESAPLSQALRWAERSNASVRVVPGADHFFAGRLDMLSALISERIKSKI
ncbi:Alpha/beta hydrolase family protein [compost metagenome]